MMHDTSCKTARLKVDRTDHGRIERGRLTKKQLMMSMRLGLEHVRIVFLPKLALQQEQFPVPRQNWNWRMFRRPVIQKLGLSLPLPERNPYIVGISMILYENGDCMLLQFSGWWLSYYPSEKNEFVNWDDDIPNVWGKKSCSKPPPRKGTGELLIWLYVHDGNDRAVIEGCHC